MLQMQVSPKTIDVLPKPGSLPCTYRPACRSICHGQGASTRHLRSETWSPQPLYRESGGPQPISVGTALLGHIYIYTHVCKHTHTCVSIFMSVSISISISVSISFSTSKPISNYVYVSIYPYIHFTIHAIYLYVSI